MQKNIKNQNRRKFVKHTALASFATWIGMPVVFAENFPSTLKPAALLDRAWADNLPGKSDALTILNDRPVNAETAAHLLDPLRTPNNLFFVRNNGLPPRTVDVDTWTLTVSGESAKQKKIYTLKDLKTKFKQHTLSITLECGGNGRSEFNPPAKGNQWSTGAVGCAAWTGIKLADVLADVGVKSDAVYIGYYGKDDHLSGDPNKDSISRGVPIEKAMEAESMIAWSMNGTDIPMLNGHPLRLVFGGFPASCSGKWLSEIVIRDQVHDGQKMKGQAYRTPCKPVAPGTKVEDKNMCIIEDMPVKSLITFPQTGATIRSGQSLPVRGHAWTSATAIKLVECSIDFGKSWQTCTLTAAENRYAWQRFETKFQFPQAGYYEVWARATDTNEQTQPMILPGWNPKGYLNNACHRIAVKVTDE